MAAALQAGRWRDQDWHDAALIRQRSRHRRNIPVLPGPGRCFDLARRHSAPGRCAVSAARGGRQTYTLHAVGGVPMMKPRAGRRRQHRPIPTAITTCLYEHDAATSPPRVSLNLCPIGVKSRSLPVRRLRPAFRRCRLRRQLLCASRAAWPLMALYRHSGVRPAGADLWLTSRAPRVGTPEGQRSRCGRLMDVTGCPDYPGH